MSAASIRRMASDNSAPLPLFRPAAVAAQRRDECGGIVLTRAWSFTILSAFLAALAVGELWYRKGAEKTYVAIANGFAEVLPESVTILAQLAERPEDIDVARAEAARKRAEDRLKSSAADFDVPRAGLALIKAFNRLQVSSRDTGKKVRT